MRSSAGSSAARVAVGILAVGIACACGSNESLPRETDVAAAGQQQAPPPGARPCPQQVELTESDLGCQCGIETLVPRQIADLPGARAIQPGVMWRCNPKNQLELTLDRREVP